MAYRTDRASIGSFARTPSGGLRVPARPTRSGVLRYRKADGSVVREYRPPSEVSDPESLESLRGAPLTVGHPPEGRVTPENWAALSVGSVSAPAGYDGRHVTTDVDVLRADAVRGVEDRTLVELSAAYDCDEDATPGVSPDGEAYDVVQRNIRYNHVALLPVGRGRAGRDTALRLDAAEEITDMDIEALKARIAELEAMLAAKNEPVEDAADEGAALKARIAELEAMLAEKTDAADKATARADAAEASIPARVAARRALEDRVNGIVAVDAKMSDRAILEAVAVKAGLRQDASDEYLLGALEGIARGDALAAALATKPAQKQDADESPYDRHVRLMRST